MVIGKRAAAKRMGIQEGAKGNRDERCYRW
jgi:hypothetical protein